MVGTQFTQTEREIGLKLPAAGQLKAMVAQPDRREVAVLADGKIVFDGQPVTTEQLTQRLRSMLVRYPDLRVAVRADADAKYQSVITAMSAVQGAGVTDLTTAYLVSANIYR
jgi:biopolymer transport protein ExbD